MQTPSPVQTTYSQYYKPGQVGQIASGSTADIDTRLAEDPAGTGIPFGRAVFQGTQSDRAGTLGELSGSIFVGITCADPTLPNLVSATTDMYLDKDNMSVMVRGDIWVAPATNVAAGSAVYCNTVTGELGGSGISNALQIEHARWMTAYPLTEAGLPATTIAVVRIYNPINT